MPTAAEFQALHDELRQLGAVFVQAASLGDQELALWAVGALASAAAKPGWWAREAADRHRGQSSLTAPLPHHPACGSAPGLAGTPPATAVHGFPATRSAGSGLFRVCPDHPPLPHPGWPSPVSMLAGASIGGQTLADLADAIRAAGTLTDDQAAAVWRGLADVAKALRKAGHPKPKRERPAPVALPGQADPAPAVFPPASTGV